jgi:hypothetical protein
MSDPLAAHGLRRVFLLLARHAEKVAHDSLLAIRDIRERIMLF